MNKLSKYVQRTIQNSKTSMKKIHKHMEGMQNIKEFKHIQKYCDSKCNKIEKYIYQDSDGVEDAKYTYTWLTIKQMDLYKYLISYLKRKKTMADHPMLGIDYIIDTLEKVINGIKLKDLDTLSGTDRNSMKYTEIDLKKMEWFCYNNLIKIINDLYAFTDINNVDIESSYKEAGLL